MDDYAGRVLADRYRLPLPPSDEYELVETRAFDTYSGQEVLVRQLPLPEVVDAEFVEFVEGEGPAGPGGPTGPGGRGGPAGTRVPPHRAPGGRAVRRSSDPAVRRAIEAAQAAAQIPDHPRLDQVYDVFAEAGSLWIVSELVAARPLAALLAEKPLTPYRAAEIGSDVLTALRALHAHGWVHRNITVRTVLVCDDGRVVLTGLAAGAAEEALCGYAPVPDPDPDPDADDGFPHAPAPPAVPAGPAPPAPLPALAPGYELAAPTLPQPPARPEPAVPDGRASRAGAIAAYRAGARAAARAQEAGAALSLPPPPRGPAAPAGGTPADYEPQWWSQAAELDDDDDHDGDGDDDTGEGKGEGYGDAPRRALLTGTWSDGPGSGSVPAGGGVSPYGTRDALRADAQRAARSPDRSAPAHSAAPSPAEPGGGRWDDAVAGDRAAAPRYRGPATPLAAERARQTRIAVVGAVTERWAPEQAGPVHETWQLAPPIGPATDLWALGALLYRAVQGHAPYPEENAAELVQLVCAEPPAFAEECGPLRPVVESLLRQDPTERPDFEELRGWLRSLIRSAPEPDAGSGIVPMPSVDGTRLPVVRRRGELVRRRRPGGPGAPHGRHRHSKKARSAKSPGTARAPRALGRTLLLVILLALAAAIAYAVVFMPKAEPQDRGQGPRSPQQSPQPQQPGQSQSDDPRDPPQEQPSPGGQAPSTNTVTPDSSGATSPGMAAGYTVRDDPEGFRVGVDKSWRRSPINDVGQIRYTGGDFTLIVVPGRDTVREGGSDPLEYQRTKERELQPWRDSSWATATGLRRIDVGRQVMAEGQFTWTDVNGREVYVRNLALVVGDRYHVIQVIGPESQRDKVSEIYQQAVKVYRSTR